MISTVPQQSAGPINRIVKHLHGMCILSAAQSERLIGELSKFPSCLYQIIERSMSLPDRLSHAVLNNPALEVYRLPGWRRQLDPGGILEHPSDLLKVLPGTLAGSSGRLQLIE